MTSKFRQRIEKGETLDSLLPEAFALVREASVRTLGMRHFDVQLMGGIVLHQGRITEMKTGEGKTLVATLPVYLNALAGKGVHVVTVNDYLARRDAEWMGTIYKFLGLEVGVIQHDMSPLRAPEGVPLRRHLRHQQRVRLRLPARQHGRAPEPPGPAARSITPSSTRSTRSSSTRRGRRSSYPDRPRNRPRNISSSTRSSSTSRTRLTTRSTRKTAT